MSQRIHVGAALFREGRMFLLRERPDSEWQLPSGPLLPEHDDVDAGMDSVLAAFGVSAPAVEEDFVETVYLRSGEETIVFNLYVPTEWEGHPKVEPGVGSGWFGPDELQALTMDHRVRQALLVSLGMSEPEDDSARIISAFGGFTATDEPAPAQSNARHEQPAPPADGMDVLRTLSGGDAGRAFTGLQRRYPEMAGDVVSAIDMAWTGPALDRKTRSLQVVAMLGALGGRSGPLRSHINGALNHGATPEQLVETMKMVAVYGGFPAALEAWPVMEAVFAERGIPRPGGL